MGQYEKAIEYYNRSLPIKESIGNDLDTALDLTNLGLCSSSLGQYEKAIVYHSRCPRDCVKRAATSEISGRATLTSLAPC
jgi:tetratricopeptide (TPR) repeat protein